MKFQALLCAVLLPLLAHGASAQNTVVPTTANKIPDGAGRLGFFAAKVRAKEPVLVAAIGGSITQGVGASSVPKGYIWQFVARVGRDIKERGGSMSFQWAPAGGTDSTFGAYRVGAQLLKLTPDLLLIEFAVNDMNNPQALDGMEGIVRQAWRQNPKMGVVFFETTSATYENNYYVKNTLPTAVKTHQQLAAHYNIPLVNSGPDVHNGLVKGDFTNETFWKDGTHPSDVGHTFYASLLGEALIPTLDQPAPSVAPALPIPLGTGALEGARFAPVVPTEPVGGWTASDKDWFASHKWVASELKPLTFRLGGQSLALVYRGSMNLRWKSADGTEQMASLSQRNTTPSPVQFVFSDATLPADTLITAEPIADANGKTNAEIYGFLSVVKP